MRILCNRINSLRNDRGAAAVEFALVVPILLMLVFGAIEYGRIYSELEVLESAAREGARAASVRGDALAVQTAVETAANPYTLDGTPGADKVCDGSTIGQPVTVSWTQNFQVSIALLPPVNVNRVIKGVFRCE